MADISPLVDRFGRSVTYLRVSVTDRCNLRCAYCMPAEAPALECGDILRYEEIVRVAAVGVSLGVRKVRVTGGEPLVRKGVEGLIGYLSGLGLEELALTTNGILLAAAAEGLKKAGLQRINVSLDTLRAGRYPEICKRGSVEEVVYGIREAKRVGLVPIKVNAVVMRGVNEDELEDFVDFGLREDVTVRFIEYMPGRRSYDWRERYVSRDEMLLRLAGRLDADAMRAAPPSHTPARYYRLREGGALGIISPVSHNFCGLCNRMRLTPDGRLLSCLMSSGGVDVKTPIRAGADDERIAALFAESLAQKGSRGEVLTARPEMNAIGG